MKNIISNFFGKKSIDDLEINDLDIFFSTPQVETSTIEFKSGSGLLEIDVFREITAFLNTEGGILILGSPMEQIDVTSKEKACFGQLIPTNFKSSLWLSQKIFSNITPPPTGIKIKELPIDGGKVFILNIPQSNNPPHQYNSEGRYYIRIDTEAKPAPHGFVSALFQKRQLPQLKSKIVFEKENLLRIYLTNESIYPAEKIQGIILLINAFPVIPSDFSSLTMNPVYDDVFENHYSGNFNSEGILVSSISMTNSIQIYKQLNPFLVIVNYWSKVNDLKIDTFILDPEKSLVTHYDWINSNQSLEELLQNIKGQN